VSRSRWRRGGALALVPLGLALLALSVRETTRQIDAEPRELARARPFVVPAALLAAVRAPNAAERCTVDEERSLATWNWLGSEESCPLRVTGSVLLLPDPGLGQLQLEIGDPSQRRDPAAPSFSVSQLHDTLCNTSEVPNARTCTIVCQARLFGGTHQLRWEAATMLLPNGELRLQGVAFVGDPPAAIDPPPLLPWRARPRATLSLDLVLKREG
jgi:hypothetical protein